MKVQVKKKILMKGDINLETVKNEIKRRLFKDQTEDVDFNILFENNKKEKITIDDKSLKDIEAKDVYLEMIKKK